MTTSTQFWSLAGWRVLPDGTLVMDGSMLLRESGSSFIGKAFFFDETQALQVEQAMGLWDDVSGFTAVYIPDNMDLARHSSSLQNDWNRIALGNIVNPGVEGVNKSLGYYHEIYLEMDLQGVDTMLPGSSAFSDLLHEIGHSVLGNLDPKRTDASVNEDQKHFAETDPWTIMDTSEPNDAATWHPSTPMTYDIDYATSLYGPATTTRTGDDTYGFNAHFSGPARSAFDFNINKHPLVTIFDNDGIDTLDASGFDRPVGVDLRPGATSFMRDGAHETFAVIYKGIGPSTWIENAVGGNGDDELRGNDTVNILTGNGGADSLDGEKDGFVDTLIGGWGDDTYVIGEQENIVELADGGDDTVVTSFNVYFLPQNIENVKYFEPTSAMVYFAGNDLDNRLTGSNGDDVLIGYDGNDTLYGGAGADWMEGGRGNDKYAVDDYGDQVIEVPNEQLVNFGSTLFPLDVGGTDTVYAWVADYQLGDYVENLQFMDVYLPADPYSLGILVPMPIAHTGYGNALDNTIIGASGDDALFGEFGNDVLVGGAGDDVMHGGTGSDVYSVDSYGDHVSEETFSVYGFSYDSGGIDEIQTYLSVYWLEENYDSRIENLTYKGPDTFVGLGNSLDNVITGGDGGDRTLGDTLYGFAGSDLLDGGDGGDTLIGGAGNDALHGGDGMDKLVIDNGNELGGDVAVGGEDYDTVQADDSVAATGLNLVLFPTGTPYTAAVNGVVGQSAAMEIERVIGGTGNDRVDASRVSGRDHSVVFEGHEGSDTFISGKPGDARFDGGEGSDTIEYSGAGANYLIRHALASDLGPGFGVDPGIVLVVDRTTGQKDWLLDVETIKFGNGTSVDVAQALAAGGSFIPGEGLIGTAGEDHFHFAGHWGSTKVLGFTHGQDLLDLTGVSGLRGMGQLAFSDTTEGARIAFGADSIVLQGVKVGSLNGVDFLFNHDAFVAGSVPGQTRIGTSGSDTFTGGAGDDRLEGGGGMDFLTGGAGADQLIGGAGTDFLYTDADDTLIDGGADFDYLYLDSSKSYGASFKVAGTNVESVSGTLVDDRIDATGVSYGVYMNGNYGKDVLIGGAGNDRLDGSADDDSLTGGGGNDSFLFSGRWGKDTITDFAHGHDVLDLAGVSGLSALSQLVIADTAEGARIAYGDNSILLQGITAASLTASDFHFH